MADEGRRTRPRQPRTSPLPRGTRGAGCRMQRVRPWLPMSPRAEARTQHQVLGAWWRAQTSRPSLLTRLALRLPASRRWGALGPLVDMVPWIPTGTAGFFFRRDIAILSSFRMAGESFMVEKDLIKANSSCLSMMLRQELYYATKDTGLPMRSVTVCAGTTRPVRKSLLARCP